MRHKYTSFLLSLSLFYVFSSNNCFKESFHYPFKKKLYKFFNTKYMQMTFVCYLERFFFIPFLCVFSIFFCVVFRLTRGKRKSLQTVLWTFLSFFQCKKKSQNWILKFLSVFFCLFNAKWSRKERVFWKAGKV